MPLESIPLWTTRPDWSQPVVETLEWRTAVLSSRTGAEQRQALRLTPRRSLEFTATVRGSARTYFLGFLDRYGASEFYLPLWYEPGQLVRSEHTGSLDALIDRESAETAAGEAICAALPTPYGWPIAPVSSGVASGGATRLTLGAPGWSAAAPKGAPVFSVVRARLDTSAVSWTRHTDDLVVATVRADLMGAQPWGGAPDLDTYAGLPVVDLRPNEGRTQTGATARLLLDLDNETGARTWLDLADRAFPTTGAGLTRVLRGPAEELRSLLYLLRGRVGQAWFASPLADFRLAVSAETGDNQLVVSRGGYADHGGPTEDNDRIMVRLRDGTKYYRQITGAAVVDGGETELLTLDSGFDLGLDPSKVQRIGFLVPGRLDQDRFEIAHVTDTEGVCETAVAIKRVPVLRSAAGWNPLPFPDDGPL
jgi:hypothetical protein